MTTTAPAPHDLEQSPAATLDVEALFPADPELMTSPEGDKRGLHELQDAARQRRSQLQHR